MWTVKQDLFSITQGGGLLLAGIATGVAGDG
jgi:hypothetical protein